MVKLKMNITSSTTDKKDAFFRPASVHFTRMIKFRKHACCTYLSDQEPVHISDGEIYSVAELTS